jgi:peptide/nickel transport system permease protein
MTAAPGEAKRLRLTWIGKFLRDWRLAVGAVLLVALLLFGTIGPLLVHREMTRLGAGDFTAPPSLQHPFGTDTAGRDVLAMMIYGTLPTLGIGLIAGTVATAIGVFLGLVTGYFRGPLDVIFSTFTDVMLAFPSFLVIVVISSYIRDTGVVTISLVIAIFAWPGVARAIRGQVLRMRELAFVEMARISGLGNLRIVVQEIMPNLLPFIAVGFISGVLGGIGASVWLQLLGLGDVTIPTVAMILSNAYRSAAISRNLWWWWASPALYLILLFVGLFLVSQALDEIANPRLQGRRQ